MKEKITVIGAGISGITTALTLQLFGFQTVCYAAQIVKKKTPWNPRFASLYPAASIIPHSVKHEHLGRLFKTSLAVFQKFYEQKHSWLFVHRHFEVFEFPKKHPAYLNSLKHVSSIDETQHSKLPHRREAPELHGWSYDCFVAQWPQYVHHLYDLYSQAGGKIYQQKLYRFDLGKLPGKLLINCSGLGSVGLFEDSASPKLVRGHVIHLPNRTPPVDDKNRPISYNYTPRPSIYSTPAGAPCDVYFYPTSNRWILGGSRQVGTLDNDGQWKGSEQTDTVDVHGLAVPRQIIALNRKILKNTFKIEFGESQSDLKARIGYRFMRKGQENGLRLALSEAFSKKIVHNYGHGGAGVTLSWGCALEVIRLVASLKMPHLAPSPPKNDSIILKHLQLKLQKLYLKYFQ